MKIFDFRDVDAPRLIEPTPLRFSKVFPDDCILLQNTAVVLSNGSWKKTHPELKMLRDQNITARFVLVDGSYDPISFSNRELLENLDKIQTYFPTAKVALLSSRVEHYYENIPKLIYLPNCLMVNYVQYDHRPRQKRIGCLNRNNTAHRVWLMHTLLKNQLLRDDCDVYSMSFANISSNARYDIRSWLGNSLSPLDINYELNQWPDSVATHPDGYPNDYTVDHPAWHTAISIVTETECGWTTMITEKTWKAIRSRSCWSAYMSDAGYQFLRDMGFEPDFFDRHASFVDIEPIVKICKTFDTETVALDYYHSQINKINHNFEWSGGDNQDAVTNFTAPGAQKFLLKFQQDLARL